MLTATQVETAAYRDENGTLYCPDCFDRGDAYCLPVSRYALDEEQSAMSEGSFDWDYADDIREVDGERRALIGDVWHVEACGCEHALEDDYGHELVEAYVDYQCAALDDQS